MYITNAIVYFFSKQGKSFAFYIDIGEAKTSTRPKPGKLKRYKVDESDPGTSYIDYSQISANFLAPASINFLLSLLIC